MSSLLPSSSFCSSFCSSLEHSDSPNKAPDRGSQFDSSSSPTLQAMATGHGLSLLPTVAGTDSGVRDQSNYRGREFQSSNYRVREILERCHDSDALATPFAKEKKKKFFFSFFPKGQFSKFSATVLGLSVSRNFFWRGQLSVGGFR